MTPLSRGYRILRLLVRIIYPLQAQLHVYHAERVPAEGPVLLVSNHLGLTDQFALGLAVERQLRILTKAELFNWPIIGGLARLAGLVPVQRGGSDREALQTAVRLLRAGDCVLVHPEGTFSRPPAPAAMRPFKTGAAWLALRTTVWVVPVGIWGSELVWAPRRQWRFWQRPHVTVSFGEPYIPDIRINGALSYGSATKAMLQAVTDDMGYRVAALLPEQYRGYYGFGFQPGSVGYPGNTSVSQSSEQQLGMW
jgi:1-acyl-sn-glycerol-3-phosphate acyltransferase